MDKYVIHGGKPLYGEVEISGAKNAAVAIIPAALMVDGVCRLENIPQISDADMLLTILEHLGESDVLTSFIDEDHRVLACVDSGIRHDYELPTSTGAAAEPVHHPQVVIP